MTQKPCCIKWCCALAVGGKITTCIVHTRYLYPKNPQCKEDYPGCSEMTWYLAGPMSGIKRHNYPAFTAACTLLRDLEWSILSPHEEHPFMETRDTTPEEWQTLLRQDIRLLLDCQGIILLPRWSDSKGAQLECYVAAQLGMSIKCLIDTRVEDVTAKARNMAAIVTSKIK